MDRTDWWDAKDSVDGILTMLWRLDVINPEAARLRWNYDGLEILFSSLRSSKIRK